MSSPETHRTRVYISPDENRSRETDDKHHSLMTNSMAGFLSVLKKKLSVTILTLLNEIKSIEETL
jgi:hypothetical protein